MGLIRAILGIAIVFLIVVFGYWLYATYTVTTGTADTWAAINNQMPDPLRKWSCTEVKARATGAAPPLSCSDAW